MNNNNTQELKPVYIHEASYISDDEVGLIDLAMVLIRQKKLMAAVFITILVFGVISALLTPKVHTYTISIQIGSRVIQGISQPFESTQTLLAKLQHSFIPHTLEMQRLSYPDSKNHYQVEASVPLNSEIIILQTKATNDGATLASQLLRNISNAVTSDHEQIFNALKQNLSASINQAKAELVILNSSQNSQIEEQQLILKNIEFYQGKLANLQNTREVSPPMKSNEPTGPSRKLIVIIAAILGLGIAVVAAFFAEFVKKVKEKSKT